MYSKRQKISKRNITLMGRLWCHMGTIWAPCGYNMGTIWLPVRSWSAHGWLVDQLVDERWRWADGGGRRLVDVIPVTCQLFFNYFWITFEWFWNYLSHLVTAEILLSNL